MRLNRSITNYYKEANTTGDVKSHVILHCIQINDWDV